MEREAIRKTERLLARRGLKSLSVTSDTNNALCGATTWHVLVALMERRFMNSRMTPFQSTAATSYALDVIYALLFSKDTTSSSSHCQR